jgi:hypothetical protein
MRGIKKYLAVTVMSAALFVLSPWPPAKGYEICDRYKTVGSIGDPCTPHNLVKDEIDIAGEKTKFSVQISVARRKYFDAYPNGPGLAKAAADFSNLLFQKDAYYLYLVLMQEGLSRDAKVPLIEKVRALDKILGIVQIDGGIHRAAIPEFTDWAETFLAKLDQAGPTIGARKPNRTKAGRRGQGR